MIALFSNRKGGGKGACFRCGRKGHRQAQCKTTTVLGQAKGDKGKGKPKGKGKGKGNFKDKGGKGKGNDTTGKGPKGGSWNCGQAHYATNCPNKGKGGKVGRIAS